MMHPIYEIEMIHILLCMQSMVAEIRTRTPLRDSRVGARLWPSATLGATTSLHKCFGQVPYLASHVRILHAHKCVFYLHLKQELNATCGNVC